MSFAMTSPPYRGPDGHLRVSDHERDAVIDLLAQAATDGRLSLEECRERSHRALTALTRADLKPLTYDLDASAAAPRHTRSPGVPGDPPVGRLTAVFGRETRRGPWTVAERLTCLAVLGECRIDLQEAAFCGPVTLIEASAYLGTVEILVPDGVHVRMSGTSIGGSRACQVRLAPPGAPVVEVRAHTVLGEVVVRRPRWRDGVRKIIGELVGEQLYRYHRL